MAVEEVTNLQLDLKPCRIYQESEEGNLILIEVKQEDGTCDDDNQSESGGEKNSIQEAATAEAPSAGDNEASLTLEVTDLNASQDSTAAQDSTAGQDDSEAGAAPPRPAPPAKKVYKRNRKVMEPDYVHCFCTKCVKTYTYNIHRSRFEKITECEACGSVLKYICPSCTKLYTTLNHARRHHKFACQKEGRYECSECDLKFTSNFNMRKHFTAKHEPRGPKNQLCYKCGSLFTTYRYLVQHERDCGLSKLEKRSTNYRYFCDLCDYKCVLKNRLRRHMSHTHAESENVACPDCGKLFKFEKYLVAHKTIYYRRCEKYKKMREEAKERGEGSTLEYSDDDYDEDLETRKKKRLKAQKKQSRGVKRKRNGKLEEGERKKRGRPPKSPLKKRRKTSSSENESSEPIITAAADANANVIPEQAKESSEETLDQRRKKDEELLKKFQDRIIKDVKVVLERIVVNKNVSSSVKSKINTQSKDPKSNDDQENPTESEDPVNCTEREDLTSADSKSNVDQENPTESEDPVNCTEREDLTSADPKSNVDQENPTESEDPVNCTEREDLTSADPKSNVDQENPTESEDPVNRTEREDLTNELTEPDDLKSSAECEKLMNNFTESDDLNKSVESEKLTEKITESQDLTSPVVERENPSNSNTVAKVSENTVEPVKTTLITESQNPKSSVIERKNPSNNNAKPEVSKSTAAREKPSSRYNCPAVRKSSRFRPEIDYRKLTRED